ncbi:MAG: hypothetical protein ACD_3C00215G0007 [uncultured bacterium (gcode 4)]|uniref:Trigger factor n=1 Tax=uncultured bacterium (gcode 4) TaxID=1234023 RepID=K2GB24_9BACT|nr:MAG: hypothetical protein ACD_3C00215G0007 [uncultured bacterium (gcode 4)]
MQVTKKQINSYTLELIVKESGVEFEKAKEKALAELSEHANIKWFRKWSAIPEDILVKTYWAHVIENEAIDKLLNSLYPKIIKKEWIVPTWPAMIKEVKSTNPFEIIMEIEILPSIEIDEKKVKKIKLKKEPAKVEQDEIDSTIKEIEKKFTKFESQEWVTAQIWDRVTLDTEWFDKKDWVEITETKVQAFPLVLWSGSFIPWFEEKLTGAKVWDVVEFDITFPADYHSKDFQSRKVYFVTTVFNIEKAIAPEWTPEFIEKLRWVVTDFEWFKKLISEEIKQEKEHRVRLDEESKLLQELDKVSTVELGQHLIAHEVDRVFQEHVQNLEAQGIDLKHYLEHLKKDEEGYKKEAIEPEAIRRLKAELILEKLKEIIVVEISEDEIQQEIDKIMTQYASEEVKDRLKAKLVPGDAYYEDIKNRMKYRKIVDTFFES